MNTYHNPVYPHSSPDPFALKFCGAYYVYCTGHAPDGRAFPVISSTDLVHWRALGGALKPPPLAWPQYWAPEVTFYNGRFYLYYSLGDEEHMHLRVATAAHPAGPFADSGRQLTAEPFAIDAHVFADGDGRRFLFYATDFLNHSHVGTGTVVDRLLDPFTLEGRPRPVTRARFDWQVYDPQRASKNGLRWHTVEGPFVQKRKGRYYQMFSGGNWQNPTYGVSYATSASLDEPGEWAQHADGATILPILRTLPGQVIGPGHNSVVRGPDNRQLFCVYHRWTDDRSERVLAIDPLDWAGERMVVLGPSFTPQPAPNSPSSIDLFDGHTRSQRWPTSGGDWYVDGGALHQRASEGDAAAYCTRGAASFLVEVSVRSDGGAGGYGVRLGDTHEFLLEPGNGHAVGRVLKQDLGWIASEISLPENFDFNAFHLLRVERDFGRLVVTLDEVAARWEIGAPASEGFLALVTHNASASFAGFALTEGWEDLFEGEASCEERGWYGSDAWGIVDNTLTVNVTSGHEALFKGEMLYEYELVVNARHDGGAGGYGIFPASDSASRGPLLRVERDGEGWAFVNGQERHTLPPSFDGAQFQQWRVRVVGAQVGVQWEATPIADLALPPGDGPRRVGLWAGDATAAFDMVRVTRLGQHPTP